MGVRANLVLRRGGHTLIAYDKWAGERLASRVMAEALFRPCQFPEGLLDSFATREDVLMNDIWCEGGLLLDLTERRCLFFGGDGDDYAHYWHPALRADILRLIQARLSASRKDGWTAEWAEEGIASIADGAGISRSRVDTERDAGEGALHAPSTASQRLLVITRISGASRASRVAAVQVRPGLSTGLEGLARGPEHVLDRWSTLPPFEESARGRAIGGAIIDEAAGRLRLWQTRPRPVDFIRAGWPGFDVVVSTQVMAEQWAASTLMTDPTELVRYLARVAWPSGEGPIREALRGVTCTCGHVIGYGDVMPCSDDEEGSTTGELLRRVAAGPPPWCGIVDGGEYVAMDHRCPAADHGLRAAYARAHIEHAVRALEANPYPDDDLQAMADRLRQEHGPLPNEVEALLAEADEVLGHGGGR